METKNNSTELQYLLSGMPHIRNWSGGGELFKVREKSGIFILSQGKPIFLQEEKSWKIEII